MTDEIQTTASLPASHMRVAIKWLMFQHGQTVEQASDVMDGKFPSHPHGGLRQEATDVATFIVEECMDGKSETTETRYLTQTEQRILSAAQRRSVRLLCECCGKFTRDPPSHLCPGCEAYQEHQP